MLGSTIRLLARSFDYVARRIYRISDLCNGLLPALFPPRQLSKCLQDSYLDSYAIPADLNTIIPDHLALFDWERDIIDRYGIKTGHMLILGSGMGREAIGLARRGLTVTGIDTNRDALRLAHRLAALYSLPARFLQADFQALPYTSGSFSWALLSSLMYSAIPGTANRQRWLCDLFGVLEPGGLLILSFSKQQYPLSRVHRLCRAVNRILIALSRANPDYQEGDDCPQGHFLHMFQNKEELHSELIEAGATVRELGWNRGIAVVEYLPRQSFDKEQPCGTRAGGNDKNG